jgi:hypothetical protein
MEKRLDALSRNEDDTERKMFFFIIIQPLIYLSGIEFEDLQCILDFMYFGEVNIAQEKLNTFLVSSL